MALRHEVHGYSTTIGLQSQLSFPMGDQKSFIIGGISYDYPLTEKTKEKHRDVDFSLSNRLLNTIDKYSRLSSYIGFSLQYFLPQLKLGGKIYNYKLSGLGVAMTASYEIPLSSSSQK